MKKLLKNITIIAMLSMVIMGCGKETSKDVINIGIMQPIEHNALDASKEGFIAALKENGYTDGENIKLDIQNAQGDQSNLKTISQTFVSDKKDLILAIATPAAQSVAAETQDIPILITAITDPAKSKLVQSNEKPNTNVTGTSDLCSVDEQIDLLKKIVPNAEKITILYSSGEENSKIQAQMAEEAAKKVGLNVEHKTVTSTNDVAQVTESIVGTTDAIYIPTDNIIASSMPTVANITIPNKIPVITGEENMVKSGGLASVTINYYDLGYKTGEMAIEILKGNSKPQDMPIEYAENTGIIINKKYADQINLEIPEDLLSNDNVNIYE